MKRSRRSNEDETDKSNGHPWHGSTVPVLPPLPQALPRKDLTQGSAVSLLHRPRPRAPLAHGYSSRHAASLPCLAAPSSSRAASEVSLPSTPLLPRLDTRLYKRRQHPYPAGQFPVLPPPPYAMTAPGWQQAHQWQQYAPEHDTRIDGQWRSDVRGRRSGANHPFAMPPVHPAYLMNPTMWPYLYAGGGLPPMFPDVSMYGEYGPVTVSSRPGGRISGYVSPSENELLVALESRTLAAKLVDGVLERCLEDDIIPQVLMEVFIELGRDKDMKAVAAGHAAALVIDGVMEALLSQAARSVVQETMSGLVTSYLMQTGRHMSPEEHVCDDLIDSLLRVAVVAVVKETVSERAERHMWMARSGTVAMEIVQGCVEAACLEEAQQAISERCTDDLLWGVYGEVIWDQVADVCAESVREEIHDLGQQQLQEVSEFASSWLLEKLILERFLGHYATDGEAVVHQREKERFLEGVILGALLNRYYSFEDPKTMQECVPLSRLHTDLFNETAITVLLDEFVQHSDQDLLEYDTWYGEQLEKK